MCGVQNAFLWVVESRPRMLGDETIARLFDRVEDVRLSLQLMCFEWLIQPQLWQLLQMSFERMIFHAHRYSIHVVGG